MKAAFLTALLALQVHSFNAACRGPKDWSTRTIYQLLVDRFSTDDGYNGTCSSAGSLDSVYCGGTFKGIENNLEYIADMGFDAIWITPVTENVEGGYHGYWPMALYTVNHYLSSEGTVEAATKDLKQFVTAAHARDIWVMIDVVPNHMGGASVTYLDDYEIFSPFDKKEHYHDYVCGSSLCNQDPGDHFCTIPSKAYSVDGVSCKEPLMEAVDLCREAPGLFDLDQSNPFVRDNLTYWLNWITAEFQFDGIRVDSMKHASLDFWQEFKAATDCYLIGEVSEANYSCFLANYQKEGAADGLLSYPQAYVLRDVFGGLEDMRQISSIHRDMKNTFAVLSVLGTFLDNHDLDRFGSLNGDLKAAENALLYVLFSVGIPIVYYGTEQGYYGMREEDGNREPLWWSGFKTDSPLYVYLKNVIRLRKVYEVWKYEQIECYSAIDMYVFSRGPVLVTLTNQKYRISYTLPSTAHPYSPGIMICNILVTQFDCQNVQPDGSLPLTLLGGEQKIWVASSSPAGVTGKAD